VTAMLPLLILTAECALSVWPYLSTFHLTTKGNNHE